MPSYNNVLVAFGDLSWLLGAVLVIGLIVGALALVGWVLMMIIGSIGGPILEFADKRKKFTRKEIWTNILFLLGGVILLFCVVTMIIDIFH